VNWTVHPALHLWQILPTVRVLGIARLEQSERKYHTNLAMKEKALAKVAPIGNRFRRFRANDRLLAFLESL